MGRLRILCLSPYFLPGRHGGGSVTALASLVAHLKADVELVVATGDHDLLATTPYPPALQQEARSQSGVDIHYLPRGWRAALPLWRLLRQRWDLIYLNSFLSPTFCALPLLLRRVGFSRTPVLVAPRGELMAGALQQRRSSKLAYLQVLRSSGLLRGAQFHATSEQEARELDALGLTPVALAADLPPQVPTLPPLQACVPAPLRVVFLSRIEAKKNLLFALQSLARVELPIRFDIVGPVNDQHYWTACRAAMEALPGHIQARYLGPVEPAQVLPTLAGHELFLFPTQAENNGYVIHEALLAGCALLISDQTPWRELADAGVGEDLPLTHDAFAAAVTRFAQLPPSQRLANRERARAYGIARLDASEQAQATLRMFTKASG